jgi:hypothetical protein
MKREELTPIELECNMGPDVNGVVHREPWKAYDIDEVNQVLDVKDAEIASLKAENESLKAKLDTVNELVKTSKDLYDRTIESLKANHYADSVDAGMRERRLSRALWMHRAITAKFNKEACKAMREYNPFIGIEEYKWQEVERKCRAMAEEYK